MTVFVTVFLLSLRQTLRSGRTAVLALVCLLPAGLLVFARSQPEGLPSGEELLGFLNGIYLQLCLLMVPLVYGAGVLTDDVDSGALVYVLVRPVPRAVALLGRVLAVVLASVLMVGGSLALVWVVVGGAEPWAAAHLGVMSLGAAVLACVFVLFGVAVKRAFVLGLVYCFSWEIVLSSTELPLRHFAVTFQLQSLLAGIDGVPIPTSALHQVPGVALQTLVAIAIACLALAVFVFRRKELPGGGG